jgi:inner membrane protein
MDPLTHGLLGASLGQALAGPVLGRRALVAGAILGMAPDVDVIAIRSGPLAEWLWHRGFTHSLWFGPVVGALAGYALWRWMGGPLRTWITLAALALLTHPLLDLVTSYGTQLLAPFSHRRFALGAVAIIDPTYSLVLAAGILVGLRAGLASAASTRAARQVLAVSTLYLALGLWVNARVEAEARAQLRALGVEAAEVTAYPTLLQLPFRRIVARSGDTVRVGWLSALRPRPIQWESFTQASGPLVAAARTTPEVRVFEWFAMGEATPRVAAGPEGSVVEFDDLRYGLPGAARDGFWGVRVRLSGDGRPLGPAERFNRELRTPVSRLLRTLWRETLGLS